MLPRLRQMFLPSSANSIVGNIVRIAPEESVLQLIYKGKCLPILLLWSRSMSPQKADLRSLDFVIDRLFTKLFRMNNMDTVRGVLVYK